MLFIHIACFKVKCHGSLMFVAYQTQLLMIGVNDFYSWWSLKTLAKECNLLKDHNCPEMKGLYYIKAWSWSMIRDLLKII
jgi:hypothetical protein